jgi:cation transport regulator ChaB
MASIEALMPSLRGHGYLVPRWTTEVVAVPRGKGKGEEPQMPSTILRSDARAQEIWKKAHDSAVETYGEGEIAHRVAFAALKREYRKEGDRWVRKEEARDSDRRTRRGRSSTGHKGSRGRRSPS